MEVSGQLHAPEALPREHASRFPLDRRLDGPQSRFGSYEEEKNLSPARNGTQAVQLVVRRYTDRAIQAPL
jgi:hypothetical protein